MDDSKSLNNWSKQLTINSVYIIDYGKKFPVTDKGSFSRKIAKLKYFNALNNISKLISGEINEIPVKTTPWRSKELNKSLLVQVSTFGLQGSIIHMFVEEYIPKEKERKEIEKEEKEKEIVNDHDDYHILTISARSYTALLELGDYYMNILDRMEEEKEDISNLCYSSNVGRQHFEEYRLSICGRNVTELYNNLDYQLEKYRNRHLKLNDSKINRNFIHTINIIAENCNNDSERYEVLKKLSTELYLSNSLYKQAFDQYYDIFSDISGNNNFSSIHTSLNIHILSFYYALSKVLNKSITIKQSSFYGYGLGEIISILIKNGISLKKAMTFLLLVNEKKETCLETWYNEKENGNFLLEKNIHCCSQQGLLKANEVIPIDYYITFYQKLIEEEKEDIKSLETMGNYIVNNYEHKNVRIYLFLVKNSLLMVMLKNF